jgi:hypothetical protein
MRFDNDRLSHWIAGAAFSWLMMFLLVGLPLFHFWLKIPIVRIATFNGICCAVQLAITPWLFSARATRENPAGRVAQRAAAVVLCSSALALLFFYYSRILNRISVGTVVVFALVILARYSLWPRRYSASTTATIRQKPDRGQ